MLSLGGQVVLEYYCLVCGRRFGSKQGLRGHLRVHKGELVETSFRVPKTTNKAFKEVCRAHGLTTCHMLVMFMDAVVQAFRKGGLVEFDVRTEELRVKGGLNPIMVNVYQTFLGKPRSSWKVPVFRHIHSLELGCECCSSQAEFLHIEYEDGIGYVYLALCEAHHLEDLKQSSQCVYIPLREASIHEYKRDSR